ncbi:MAG: hypothetical protein VXY35_07065, partial [Candidatus Thermoplasmatota archaeon]|nr:hypothetical protein [Candidatus Thermoplasmatota archaeon]
APVSSKLSPRACKLLKHENRAPVQARARFLQNRIFELDGKKHPKIIEKSMDFEVENHEKSMQKRIEKTILF